MSGMYLLIGAPIEDSDQPAHSRSLIRILAERIFWIAKTAKFLHVYNEDPDWTARMSEGTFLALELKNSTNNWQPVPTLLGHYVGVVSV